MKTAEYCVDYLSHQWNPTTDDLITTYKEICKQRQKYVVKEITATTSLLIKNEKKLKKSEEYKLKRHQNALWRSMSRHCTNHLGKSNKLINPATVSWQKESDITWLYGPMYYSTNMDSSDKRNAQQQPSLLQQGLKPVLKKNKSVTQQLKIPQKQHMLSTCSDDASLLLFYSTIVTDIQQQQHDFLSSGGSSVTTSASSSTRSSFSSVSSSSSGGTSKIGVHFNPEIIEIEYQPEYPVSLESSSSSCPTTDYGFRSEEEYDEEAQDDDAIWSLLVGASKSFSYTQISFLFSKCLSLYQQQQNTSKNHQHYHKKHYIPTKYHNQQNNKYHSAQLFYLMISMMKLTTTWILYQSLVPLSSWLSLTKPSSGSASDNNTAGQSKTSTTKKARLIIL